MLEFIQSVLTIAEIIVGLGILIFLHEGGHFLMAKRNGVRVEAFSLGMGPILWKRRWGDTEYRISAIPLGGYVKMAGENLGDDRTGADYELSSKSAWQRLQIFSAGAIMNLLIAFPIVILAFLAGMIEAQPLVSSPVGLPEARAGIRPGDRVLEVGGKPIVSLDQYRKEIVRQPKGKAVAVKVDRKGEAKTFDVVVGESSRHGLMGVYTSIGHITSDSPAAKAGLRSYDEIHEINGEKQFHVQPMLEQLNLLAGKEVTFGVRHRNDPPEGALSVVKMTLPQHEEMFIPQDLRLCEVAIKSIPAWGPAGEKGLKETDKLLKIDDHPIKCWQDVLDAAWPKPGSKVKIEFERDGAAGSIEVELGFNQYAKGQLGVTQESTKRIAVVAEGSVFAQAGLASGDLLIDLNGSSSIVVTKLAEGKAMPPKEWKPFTGKVRRGENIIPFTIPGQMRIVPDYKAAGFEVNTEGGLAPAQNILERRWTFSQAVSDGMWEPIDITILTFQLLGKLFKREESADNLSGPLGIFTVAKEKARTGLGNFLWLLMLITVNLGVFNLLPIPVLDGGHIMLLAIEKVKGAPLSPKFVERFQLVGVVFLLALIIFVTYNDFHRNF